MDRDIVVALVSCGGTIIGAFAGVLASSRLTVYRLERLEKEVAEHNSLIDRTYALEQHASVADERYKVTCHRIDDLEHGG